MNHTVNGLEMARNNGKLLHKIRSLTVPTHASSIIGLQLDDVFDIPCVSFASMLSGSASCFAP